MYILRIVFCVVTLLLLVTDKGFSENLITLDKSRSEARQLYHLVVKEYKKRATLEDPDAQWWYNLAKPFGKIAYLNSTVLPQAIIEFEELIRQKPNILMAQRGLKVAQLMLNYKPTKIP